MLLFCYPSVFFSTLFFNIRFLRHLREIKKVMLLYFPIESDNRKQTLYCFLLAYTSMRGNLSFRVRMQLEKCILGYSFW